MPRPSETLVDRTPLDGADVDACARIGWLLRMCRVHGGLSMSEMRGRLAAYGVSISLATLSVVERTGLRDGQIIDGYEVALGMPAGGLRAPIDTLCNMWSDAPTDRNPEPVRGRELVGFDDVYEHVSGPSPTGGDWFQLARFVGPPDSGWALPGALLRPLVDRLVSELVRSVGPAYLSRYRAVGMLQGGLYPQVVEASIRALVEQEGSDAVIINALSVVAEQPTRSLLVWVSQMLESESTTEWAAGSSSLQNMRSCGGLSDDDWDLVVPHFLRSHERFSNDPGRGAGLTELFKTLPPRVREQIAEGLTRPLTPIPAPAGWSIDRRNTHFSTCEELGRTLTRDSTLGEQPMLARLLFELVYDFRSVRRAGAAQLLMCGPLVDPLEELLLQLVQSGSDEVTRRGAIRGLHFVQAGRVRDGLQEWFTRTRPYDDASALCAAGNAGVVLPDDALDRVVGDDNTSLQVVEVLGMAGDPRLDIVSETAATPTLRKVAAWWAAHGGRVIN